MFSTLFKFICCVAISGLVHFSNLKAFAQTQPIENRSLENTSSKQTKPPKLESISFPLTVLIVNKENREIYVYPNIPLQDRRSERMSSNSQNTSQASLQENLNFITIPPLRAVLASEAEINSLAAPLSERTAIYTQTILKGISRLKLVTSANWTGTVLKVLKSTSALDKNIGQAQSVSNELAHQNFSWPPKIPLLMTDLTQTNGILAVVEVRSDSQAGVIEQIDLMAFYNKELTRTSWSRAIHDPTLFKQADDAFAQVAEKFLQRLSQTIQEATSTTDSVPLKVRLSRLVPESSFIELRKAVSKLSKKKTNGLVPLSVSRDFFEYESSLSLAQIGELRALLKKSDPNIELTLVKNTAHNRENRLSNQAEGAPPDTIELSPLKKEPQSEKTSHTR